jgi:hypothetical protein
MLSHEFMECKRPQKAEVRCREHREATNICEEQIYEMVTQEFVTEAMNKLTIFGRLHEKSKVETLIALSKLAGKRGLAL